MVLIEDLAYVTRAIEDTDEDEEDKEDEEEEEDEQMKEMNAGQAGLLWRQCANLQPLLEERKRNGADHWLNFRRFLGSFPFYISRSISIGSFS